MDYINIFFGIVTLISFFFSIYQWNINQKNKLVEKSNNVNLLQIIKHLKLQIISSTEIVHSLVQKTKESNTKIEDVKYFARIIRGQLILIIKELELESDKLSNWRFGKIYESDKNIEIESDENFDGDEVSS